MTGTSDLHPRLPVHTRRTLGADGALTADVHVRCPRRRGLVPVSVCAGCAEREGPVPEPASGPASLACRLVPTPRALAAEGRRSAAPPGPASAGDVMTPDVLCVRAEVSVRTAREVLIAGGFGGVPVVDAAGRPVGMVSKTDLLRERYEALGPDAGARAADGERREVHAVMTPHVHGVSEATSVLEAAGLMAERRVHRVPVVGGDGRVVGILSSLDVLRWVARENGYLIPSPRPSPARVE